MAVQELAPEHPIEVLRQWPDSPVDDTTLGMILGLTNPELIGDTLSPGQTTQGLNDLHARIKDYCSDRYQDLRELYPDRTKEEVNANPELLALNSVRRTLHQAMVRTHKQASRRYK